MNKIIYFFLIYTIFGLFVYWATGFSLSKNFEEIIWIFEGSIIIPLSIFLWINIKNKNINEKKIKLNDKALVTGYKSFFGSTVSTVNMNR